MRRTMRLIGLCVATANLTLILNARAQEKRGLLDKMNEKKFNSRGEVGD